MPARMMDDAQKQEVLNEIHISILEGRLDREIIRDLMGRCPGTKRSTIANWVDQIRTGMAEACQDFQQNAKINLALAEARLLYMYRKAMETADYSTADRVHEKLMKLQGIWPGKQSTNVRALIQGHTIHLGGPAGLVEDMSDQELAGGLPLMLTAEDADALIEEQDE